MSVKIQRRGAELDVELITGKKSKGGKVYKHASSEEMDTILGELTEESHGDTGGERFAKITKEELAVRRTKVQQLLMRGIHKNDIAEKLGIHLKTVYSDINAMKKQIRQNVMQLDFPLFVGETMGFYEEAKQVALRIATDETEKDKKVRLQALGAAVSAEDSKHRFLSQAGMYKAINPDKAYSNLLQSDTISMQDVLKSIETKLSNIVPDEAATVFQEAIIDEEH